MNTSLLTTFSSAAFPKTESINFKNISNLIKIMSNLSAIPTQGRQHYWIFLPNWKNPPLKFQEQLLESLNIFINKGKEEKFMICQASTQTISSITLSKSWVKNLFLLGPKSSLLAFWLTQPLSSEEKFKYKGLELLFSVKEGHVHLIINGLLKIIKSFGKAYLNLHS